MRAGRATRSCCGVATMQGRPLPRLSAELERVLSVALRGAERRGSAAEHVGLGAGACRWPSGRELAAFSKAAYA